MWVLWKKRNMRTFEKVYRDPEITAREIAYVGCVRVPPRISSIMSTFLF